MTIDSDLLVHCRCANVIRVINWDTGSVLLYDLPRSPQNPPADTVTSPSALLWGLLSKFGYDVLYILAIVGGCDYCKFAGIGETIVRSPCCSLRSPLCFAPSLLCFLLFCLH